MARILVIDSNEQFRRFMGAVLSSWGHQVETASDGEAGLVAYRRLGFELVFCDLNLPGDSGVETIARLRAEFPVVRVVVMRDYTINDIPPTPLPPALAVDVLRKPLLIPELSRVIQQHVSGNKG